MAFFSEVDATLASLRDALGEVEAGAIPGSVAALDGATVLKVLADASALVKSIETVRIAAAGVAAQRSSRDLGHSGLAQTHGHSTPVSLVQHITGSTRGEAARQVRLGESLLGAVGGVPLGDVLARPADSGPTVSAVRSWELPLAEALLQGSITPAQHDAILRGLGQPPTARHGDLLDDADAAMVAEAWSLAAEQLIGESDRSSAEELLRAARQVRDRLDPDGAADRFSQRYEARTFRMWQDEHGTHRASISFDDEMAAWVRTIIGAALRPRRGGPRFVDETEAARAKEVADDPRTNDQLTYDLMMDTLRAGAIADAAAVFGTRQPGVRVVITREALLRQTETAGETTGVGFVEDDGETLPAAVIERSVCNGGIVECTLDHHGNPLDVGREQRLFQPRQRIALALRDGGCRWHECGRPASYGEAHHIDHFADGGRTSVDRGILLCRFHHMLLHNYGWRITRDQREDFVLHPPPGHGDPRPLPSKSALRHGWLSAAPNRHESAQVG